MRIALITLAVAALAFIGSIIWIFAQRNGIDLIPKDTKTTTVSLGSEISVSDILKEQGEARYRIRELEAKIDLLSGKSQISSQLMSSTNTGASSMAGSPSQSGSSNAIIPISAKFLTKIISKVNLTLSSNTGIYGISTWDSTLPYSTYTDIKSGMTIVASRTPYTTWMKNWKSIDQSLFVVNEVKTFPFASFYLNSPKPDSTVRIVMEVESQTLLISIQKNRFEEFKKLMLKK